MKKHKIDVTKPFAHGGSSTIFRKGELSIYDRGEKGDNSDLDNL